MKRGAVLLLVSAMVLGSSVAEARPAHRIESGDTPDGIRLKFAPTLKALKDANPSIDFATLPVGKIIKDPLYDDADVAVFKQKIATLEKGLAEAGRARDDFKVRLTTAEARIGELESQNALLEPLASNAQYYRDRFRGWVGGLWIALGIALFVIVLRSRARGRLDGTIVDLQKTNALYRAMLTKAGVPLDTVGSVPKVSTIPAVAGNGADNISRA